MTTAESPEQRSLAIVERWIVYMLGLPDICAKAACRRTDKCCGDASACFRRIAPMIPDDVGEAIQVLFHGKADGLSFDELMDEEPSALLAYADWLMTIQTSARVSAPFTRRKPKEPPQSLSNS
jgi:hypothetical protein